MTLQDKIDLLIQYQRDGTKIKVEIDKTVADTRWTAYTRIIDDGPTGIYKEAFITSVYEITVHPKFWAFTLQFLNFNTANFGMWKSFRVDMYGEGHPGYPTAVIPHHLVPNPIPTSSPIPKPLGKLQYEILGTDIESIELEFELVKQKVCECGAEKIFGLQSSHSYWCPKH